MSLLKQLFLAICLLLALAFAGSFLAGVESSREQLLSQLRSHAQDAATALGLSMTPHVDDPAMIELMVSSIFDSGYFASIRVVRIPDGEVIAERRTTTTSEQVPSWFAHLVNLQPQGGDALIMRGWQQAAAVTQAAVAAQVHQTLDSDTDLATQVAFDHVLADFGAQALDFRLGQVTDLGRRIHACGIADLLRTGTADAENALQTDPDMLLGRQIDARNTRHNAISN